MLIKIIKFYIKSKMKYLSFKKFLIFKFISSYLNYDFNIKFILISYKKIYLPTF